MSTEVDRALTRLAYRHGFRGISSLRGDYHQPCLARNSEGYCVIGGWGVRFNSLNPQSYGRGRAA